MSSRSARVTIISTLLITLFPHLSTPQELTLFSSDFEEDDGGFTDTGSAEWEWGTPSYGPGTAYSGSYCWGTDLDSTYSNSADGSIYTPEIYLYPDGEPHLYFYHWYYIESCCDGGNVSISTDGGSSYSLIYPEGGYDGSPSYPGGEAFTGYISSWTQEDFDLSSYAGETVSFRFRFATDGSVTYEGWYIDDVSIVDVNPALYFEDVSEVPFTPDEDGPYEFTATIISGSGLASTLLFYSIDAASTFTSWTLLPTGEDYVYSNSISGFPLGTVIYYYIYAETSSGYSATSPDNAISDLYAMKVAEPLSIYPFQEDFEAGDGDFWAGDADETWEYGEPAAGPGYAYSGDNCWATNLSGNYENNIYSPLLSNPVSLDSATEPLLSIAHYYDMEEGVDGGKVEIYDTGTGTFNLLTPLEGYPSSTETLEECFSGSTSSWYTSYFDLDGYTGTDIILRFTIATDEEYIYPGWYIDDIAILDSTDVLLPPFNLRYTATDLENATVTLEWDSPSSDVTDYNIYYSTTSPVPLTSSTLAGSVDAGTLSFVADGVTGANYYVVTAIYPGGESAASNELEVYLEIPGIVSVSPSSGEQGETLTVSIEGLYTQWIRGSTTVSFGDGIAVNYYTVNNIEYISATIYISRDAEPGPRDVIVETGDHQDVGDGMFEVTGEGVEGNPELTEIYPSSGYQGEMVGVSITGTDTSFDEAENISVDVGEGITSETPQVLSAESIFTTLTIDIEAEPGVRGVVVTRDDVTIEGVSFEVLELPEGDDDDDEGEDTPEETTLEEEDGKWWSCLCSTLAGSDGPPLSMLLILSLLLSPWMPAMIKKGRP